MFQVKEGVLFYKSLDALKGGDSLIDNYIYLNESELSKINQKLRIFTPEEAKKQAKGYRQG